MSEHLSDTNELIRNAYRPQVKPFRLGGYTMHSSQTIQFQLLWMSPRSSNHQTPSHFSFGLFWWYLRNVHSTCMICCVMEFRNVTMGDLINYYNNRAMVIIWRREIDMLSGKLSAKFVKRDVRSKQRLRISSISSIDRNQGQSLLWHQ